MDQHSSELARPGAIAMWPELPNVIDVIISVETRNRGEKFHHARLALCSRSGNAQANG
jgi:hypothetical protein